MTTVDDEYRALTAELPPRPIQSRRMAMAVESRISELVARDQLSPAQLDYLDVLGNLLWEWESTHEPIPVVAGVELVRFLLDELGLRQKDLVPIFGTESITSEVLSGRRALQKKHIERLAEFFSVSPAAFFATAEQRPPTSRASERGTPGRSRRATSSTTEPPMAIVIDRWAEAAVHAAQRWADVNRVKVTTSIGSTATGTVTAPILFTTTAATAAHRRLTDVGQVVVLEGQDYGASTQVRLFHEALIYLSAQRANGWPRHQRLRLTRDRLHAEWQRNGSRTHSQLLPLPVGDT